jgi:hypothetical protein
VLSNSGFQYYLVVLDDFTNYTWTFPMSHKSEVFSIVLSFHAYVATQHRLPTLVFQTDNGKKSIIAPCVHSSPSNEFIFVFLVLIPCHKTARPKGFCAC